jgi:hypothetical protein
LSPGAGVTHGLEGGDTARAAAAAEAAAARIRVLKESRPRQGHQGIKASCASGVQEWVKPMAWGGGGAATQQ